MKLDSALVRRTLLQFDAQAIPDNHPAVRELDRLFGENTYFLDDNGLHIVEPTGSERRQQKVAAVIKIADWADEEHTSLKPHEPEATNVVVVLSPEKPDDGEG